MTTSPEIHRINCPVRKYRKESSHTSLPVLLISSYSPQLAKLRSYLKPHLCYITLRPPHQCVIQSMFNPLRPFLNSFRSPSTDLILSLQQEAFLIPTAQSNLTEAQHQAVAKTIVHFQNRDNLIKDPLLRFPSLYSSI